MSILSTKIFISADDFRIVRCVRCETILLTKSMPIINPMEKGSLLVLQSVVCFFFSLE